MTKTFQYSKESIMKRAIIAIIAAFSLASGAFAEASLSKSSSFPTIDGTISANEYQYQGTQKGMKLAATLGSDDVLYIAVEAPSSGWAGVGVGGLVMNGSRLFLASVLDGKASFIEKAGVGHFYADAKNLVVKKWAATTVNGVTTLELSLPSSAALWKGQINTTFAYSKSTDLASRHSSYAKATFTVK
jgi:hypothetical protein